MSKKFHVVYMTTNPENGKFYIGKHSTDNLNDGYQGSGNWVKRSIKAERNLVTTIIGKYETSELAYLAEEEFVDAMRIDCPDMCMNQTSGGLGASIGNKNKLGKKESAETRIRKSKARIGRKLADSAREKLKEFWSRKTLTEEARAKAKEKNSKWVVCLKTGVVFRTAKEAADFWGITRSMVCQLCTGTNTSSRFEFEYMDK